jgi:tryptophan-rich hypothetical protein
VNAPARTRLSPRKLLLSKWTAVAPCDRERHFLVTQLVEPSTPGGPLEQVELEAVLTKRVYRLPWRELLDPAHWHQGWK